MIKYKKVNVGDLPESSGNPFRRTALSDPDAPSPPPSAPHKIPHALLPKGVPGEPCG